MELPISNIIDIQKLENSITIGYPSFLTAKYRTFGFLFIVDVATDTETLTKITMCDKHGVEIAEFGVDHQYNDSNQYLVPPSNMTNYHFIVESTHDINGRVIVFGLQCDRMPVPEEDCCPFMDILELEEVQDSSTQRPSALTKNDFMGDN